MNNTGTKDQPVIKNFHIYKSSAGSGKTYTLVKEYLKIVLLNPAKVSHILAITFTNAAAAEMKARIVDELGNLISLKEQPHNKKARSLLNQIMTEWEEYHEPEIPTEDTVINHAGLVLKHILHRYSEFSVSTIDSFVHRVIRTFAFDLFLPFHFDVELDAESLLTQATDTLISRAGIDKNLTELLISFMLNQADDEKDLRIELQIIEMGKTLMDEDGSSSLQKLKGMSLDDFLMVAKTLRKTIKAYEVTVANQAKEAMTIIEDHQLSSSDFYQTRSGVHGYLSNLASGLTGEKITPNSYVIRTLEDDKWASGKADAAAKTAIQEIKQTLTNIITSITGPDMLLVNLYKIYTAIGKTIFPVAVLNELENILEEIKSDNVLLHISDFNKKIAGIVAEQPVPFIYERLGEKYHHYMIDEFQDTSGLQWQNLLPLIDNALAGGRMSLVVGDGKQAIYRFRNGDVEQFAALPNLTSSIRSVAKPEWEQSLTANQALKNLGTNYRSKQEIVSFNNKFFTYAKDFLSHNLKVIYDEAEQHSLPSKTGGYVEITFVDPEEVVSHPAVHTDEHSNPESNPVNTRLETTSNRRDAGSDEENDPSYQQATLSHVIEVIQRLRDAGHPLSDITILCRANHEASLVARTLLEQSIPVISSESLLLNQSDDVNFIISVIRLLSNQHDQIAAAEILGYLCKKKLIIEPDSLHGCLKEAGLFAKPRDARPSSLPDEIEKILKKMASGFLLQNSFIKTCMISAKPSSGYSSQENQRQTLSWPSSLMRYSTSLKNTTCRSTNFLNGGSRIAENFHW
jgi:ATP-dependent helicase/nuclease subunit A